MKHYSLLGDICSYILNTVLCLIILMHIFDIDLCSNESRLKNKTFIPLAWKDLW